MFDTMTILQGLAIALLSYFVVIVIGIVFPPINFPTNLPTIPFYVSFIGSYTDMDQREIYERFLREPLEQYGAAKIYFASRWNIVVSKPELLVEVFKKESIYAKSGNQKKIPKSVLAQYTGDNIISAHGQDWKLYRSIVASSIQFPEIGPVMENSKKMVALLTQEVESAKDGIVSVTDIFQKYALENIGQSVMGINFETLQSTNSAMHSQIKYVKLQIFRPFFMNFPYFDNFSIPSRNRARVAVSQFRKFYCDIIKSAFRSSCLGENFAAQKLMQALLNQVITEKQFADNATIMLVAGHENPLLLILSLVYTVAKYSHVQTKLREEIVSSENRPMPYLESVIYETLRLFPPLGQIINRETTQGVLLGSNISIPKGTYVGYNNFATGRDRTVWGVDADTFSPERWGTTMDEISKRYSVSKRNCTLPAFHGGKRACLGEKFALLEVRALLVQLLSNFKISLDPNWKEQLTPAGPICPKMLRIKFESTHGVVESQE